MDEKRERRRNCADRARANLAWEKVKRGKRLDPAMSVALQLLALTSALINLFPDFRPAAADPLPEPPRPVLVPLPDEVTRPVRYKIPPSWPLLVRDLARPVAHDEARAEVYRRLPPEVGPWLDQVFRESDWSSLRVYARSGATDQDVSRGVLAAFRVWKADQDEKARKRKKDAKGGKGAGSASKPGGGGDPGDDGGTRPTGPK